MPAIQFFTEKPTNVFDEIMPLLVEHFCETYSPVHEKLMMKPDFDTYERLEKVNAYKLFTARNVYGELVGYAGFYFRRHPHADVMTALTDLIYVKKEHRGVGHEFIQFCEEQLKKDGAGLITQSVRPTLDFSSMLTRNGYQLEETVYSKKL